jgi:hypothetical protein
MEPSCQELAQEELNNQQWNNYYESIRMAEESADTSE